MWAGTGFALLSMLLSSYEYAGVVMSRIALLIMPLLLMATVRAECIVVMDADAEIEKSESGAGEVHWQARLENRCERDQDAMLTVKFLDAGQQLVYEVQDQLIVGRLSEHDAGRKVYVPAMYLDEIEGIDIQVEERERPF
jgi:hypothetical protein